MMKKLVGRRHAVPVFKQKHIERIWGYLFCAPLVIGVLVFFIIPMGYSFFMSLTDWTGLRPGVFIGLQNYADLFDDVRFAREITNTLTYTIGVVPISIVLSVIVANKLAKKRRGAAIYTTMYFLPNVTMPAAVAIVWAWMFNSRFGPVNALLGALDLPQPVWMGDPDFIMPAIIIVSIWMGLGYNIIILLAGLKNIPSTYYEAAQIDGASERKQFFYITLPMLSPQIFFLTVMSLMGAMKVFDLIYMFTSTTPQGSLNDASRTMAYGVYEKGFVFYRMGYASAEAVILFAIIAVLTALQFGVQKRWVHYDE